MSIVSNIVNQTRSVFGRPLLHVQKHSPIIMTSVGVVGIVATAVLTARATLKLEATLDKNLDRLQWAVDSVEAGEEPANILKKTTIANAYDLAKLYALPVGVGVLTIGCVVGGNHILQKRNVAVVAALKGLEVVHANYRERVVDEYGESVDAKLASNVIEETVEDDKGKKSKVKMLDKRADFGEYTFIFGPTNPNWSGVHENNRYFLELHQNYLNDLLRARGHVFLNEVLDRLGIKHTSAGAVTGWVWNGEGDNYIDFGIYPLDGSAAKDYEISEPGHILLNFNVDGVVWDKI